MPGTILICLFCSLGLFAPAHQADLTTAKVGDNIIVITGNYFDEHMTAIATGEGVIVVDTMGTHQSTARGREIIEEFTGEPNKYLIITHFDDDHMAGTQVFRDAEIIAHENSTKYYGKQIFSNPAAKASILGLSNQLQKALESVEPDSPAAERLKKYISYFGPSFLEGFDGYEFTPPTILIGSTAEIRLGNTIARIHHPGPGHTDTDLVVLLPREKVFIAGDLILDHGMAPVIHLRNGGSVLNMIKTLEKFKGMVAEYDYVVPGHGPVHKGETISDALEYLYSLKEAVNSHIELGHTLQQAVEEIKIEKFSEYMLYDLFHPGNIAAAWSELSAGR